MKKIFYTKIIHQEPGSCQGLSGKQLTSATVALATATGTTEVVNIKRAAVSHFNVGGLPTTV